MFAPNLDFLDPRRRCFSLRKKNWKSPFEVNIDVWSNFGLNFASFWHPKSSKILPKSRFQEALKNWPILGSIFNWFWLCFEPSWSHVGHLSRPKTAQKASKTPPRRLQDSPRCLQRRFGSPKTAQDASKPSRPRRLTSFECFLVHVWLIFDWLLIDFVLMLH